MRIEIDLKDCNNALYKQNELKLNALQFNCRVTVVFVETLQGHNSLLNCFLVPVKLGKGDDYSLYRDLSVICLVFVFQILFLAMVCQIDLKLPL